MGGFLTVLTGVIWGEGPWVGACLGVNTGGSCVGSSVVILGVMCVGLWVEAGRDSEDSEAARGLGIC